MTAQRFAIAVNRHYVGKIPPGAGVEVWRVFNGQFQNEHLTADELVQAIRAGHAYTTHHRRYRDQDNFIAGQHLGLDMDTEDHRSTIEVLACDPFIREHAAFIHTTPSHKPEAPRARVVFLLDRPIPYREKYALLAQSLVARYGVADKKCKDPCRLFFGAADCDVLMLGNVLTLETAADALVNPYKQARAEEERRRQQEWERRQALRGETPNDTVIERYVNRAFEQERATIAAMRKGSNRHSAILAGAISLGGFLGAIWVPAGLVDEPRIYDTLIDAAQACGYWEEYGEADTLRTIRDGINYATPREEPLWNDPEETGETRSVIHPEIVLTPEQVEREQRAIAQIRAEGWWQGFHAGLTAGQRLAWERLGIPADAIDRYELGYSEDRGALTVPYFHGGELVNIEYREQTGAVRYESELAALFEAHEHDAPVLLLDDALTAIRVAATGDRYVPRLLSQYAILGLPQIPMRADAFEPIGDRPAIALVGPRTSDDRARALRRHARVLRLAAPLDEMFTRGLRGDELLWHVRQAA